MTAWQTADEQQSPFSHPWVAELVFGLDRILQRRHGVLEYSRDPSCLFRLEICSARHGLVLPDGARLLAGYRFARLHYWNERLPSARRNGATIGWAREFHRRIALSLNELARYFAERPELADIGVIRADVTNAVRDEDRQIIRIMQRYGFEPIAEPEPVPLLGHLHRFAENILISLMVFAQNANALRIDTLRRVRVPIYLSRRRLEQRFGNID